MRLALLLALPFLLLVTACDSSDPVPDIEDTWFAPSLEVDLASSTETPSGLYYRDITVGTGETATPGRRAFVRYSGWLPNGTRFDSNETGSAPLFDFVVGNDRVIVGWHEGVAGMRVGGVRQLIIPPHLGYGSEPVRHPNTREVIIPGNSILVFRVTLVDV